MSAVCFLPFFANAFFASGQPVTLRLALYALASHNGSCRSQGEVSDMAKVRFTRPT